jgi:hypothetical protein
MSYRVFGFLLFEHPTTDGLPARHWIHRGNIAEPDKRKLLLRYKAIGM